MVWRRRALDQQLPAAAFPAGTSAPSLVYLWATMFVVAAAVLGFTVNAQRGVPPAVVDSQLDVVSKIAGNLRSNTGAAVEELDRTVAGRADADDAALPARVVADGAVWSGAAIVETASRKPVTARGAALPYELLPPVLPANDTITVTTPDGPALVRGVILDDTRTLLAMQPLTLRNLRLNPDAGHGIFIITPDGRSSLMQGANAVDPVHLPVVFQGLAESDSRRSREVVVQEWPDRHLVVSSAPVRNAGLVVTSLLAADVAEGTSGISGLLLGLTLLAVAAPAFLLMRMSLVRPVRALLAQAKADACGVVTPHRASARVAEAQRVARALALASGDSPPPDRRWLPSVLQGLSLATVVALIWPVAAVALTLSSPAGSIPAQLVRDEENRAEAAGNSLGSALDGGLQTVSRISRSVRASDPVATSRLLERELDEARRFRVLYVIGPDGKIVTTAGRKPLRSVGPVPGETGVLLDDTVSRMPVLYAYRLIDDGFALVGEFDPDPLLGLIRNVDGRVRVVDAELRTILDSEGFRAYQPLQGELARQVAVEVLPGATVGRSSTSNGDPALIAATGLNYPDTVAQLEWSIVVEQDLAGLRLPEVVERRWTLLLAGAVVGIILLTQVWQLYIFVRPLQRLAAVSERISAGSVDLPVPPQRHDDIGAVAMCLEICRQVRHTGSARFGGAIRMRGTEEDRTTVLPPIRRHAAPSGRARKG
ncbi:HAMP domain-containing protein [Micromonospora sp. CA-111912]|uniref:HAMP domain-containing protein n=1 Tax=Micromonospora sp. CA-111912 TaxID=3239955 RepID=UPI003D8BE291